LAVFLPENSVPLYIATVANKLRRNDKYFTDIHFCQILLAYINYDEVSLPENSSIRRWLDTTVKKQNYSTVCAQVHIFSE